ncbi:AfsR/SARP family transcriptional regulator [Amycolatopsis nigrescens]|uniref:AfsR/SARP family transcriptional regulator n=1 Tax=Amycolatopsis nigrescens TaxID=381445 RepID=UPI00036B3626|nr:BTAD domain-containing putative transcriptional regulator [Amycolatopsis nigrescens]
MTYSFQVLGPLRVTADGREAAVPGGRVRTLLAGLLARANVSVTVDQLAAWLWDDGDLPANPKAAVHTYVSRLRGALGDDLIGTTSGGYRITVDEHHLDLARFTSLLDQARRAEQQGGDLAAAAALFAAALGLWRGEPFGGVRSEALLRDEGVRLSEQRFAARCRWAEVRSSLGEHEIVITELTALCGEYPLREDLRELLMIALYRAGRRADALEEYRRASRLLADELGLDPSPSLRRARQAILTSDPRLEIAAPPRPGRTPPVTPAELPAATAGFTGRDADLERLDRLLLGEAPGVGLALVVGTAGVGKTALAVHWAHRATDRFPDGQLYLNLLGFAHQAPVRTLEALTGLLGSLGVAAEQVPADIDRAAALYRSVLADRRILILLDNAATAEQVRPLLPGSPGSAVVITSRDRLPGLEASHGVRAVRLDPLPPAEAHTVLRNGIGEAAQHEPAAVATLARLCAYLPLALRIAAVNATSGGRSIADYAADLRAAGLSALEVDDDPSSAVRPAFTHSYQRLNARDQRIFRLLAAAPGPDFTPDAVAAIAGINRAEAVDSLQALTKAHLVDDLPCGRFARHDLLRSYAAELASTDDGLDQARQRLLDWYTHSADAAAKLLDPLHIRLPLPPVPTAISPVQPRSAIDAVEWLDHERDNLVAAVTHSAAHGPHDRTWRLGATLRGYFANNRRLNEWQLTAHATEIAAKADGDPLGAAAAAVNTIHLHTHNGGNPLVIDLGDAALRLVRAVGWTDAEGSLLTAIGLAHQNLGNLTVALTFHQQALALPPGRGSHAAGRQQVALDHLSTVYELMGRLEDAVTHARLALELCDRTNDDIGRALAQFAIGTAEHQRGNFATAATHLIDCLALARRLPHRATEVLGAMALSRLHCDRGDLDAARAHADLSVAIAHELADLPRQVRTLNARAGIDLVDDRIDHANERYHQALHIADHAGIQQARVETLVGLAHVNRRRGNLDHARALAEEALTSARTVGCLGHGIRAHIALARIHLETHRNRHPLNRTASLRLADEHARRAITTSTETGHRVEHARALACHAAILTALGNPPRDTAAALHRDIGLCTNWLSEIRSPSTERRPAARGRAVLGTALPEH